MSHGHISRTPNSTWVLVNSTSPDHRQTVHSSRYPEIASSCVIYGLMWPPGGVVQTLDLAYAFSFPFWRRASFGPGIALCKQAFFSWFPGSNLHFSLSTRSSRDLHISRPNLRSLFSSSRGNRRERTMMMDKERISEEDQGRGGHIWLVGVRGASVSRSDYPSGSLGSLGSLGRRQMHR